MEIASQVVSVDSRAKNLSSRFKKTRDLSDQICLPLEKEDYVVQPVVDVSPPKWHLAHTSWFFEEMILKHQEGYKEFHPDFSFLFNSYYESVGKRVLRPNRGFMTRPTVDEVYEYRAYVNAQMLQKIPYLDKDMLDLVELGIQHEQQHQELLITDIKYILGHNAIFPAYGAFQKSTAGPKLSDGWLEVESGLYEIGYDGNAFSFDNEHKKHKVYLQEFQAMDRLVTAGEYMDFIEDGAYSTFSYWLSEGWDWINEQHVEAPMYWHRSDGKWYQYTLYGFQEVDRSEPVTHVSYFEAEAFSRWKSARLLTEFEWEVLAGKYGKISADGFVDAQYLHPASQKDGNNQLFGFGWEWTQSAYLPYPGFQTAEGAVGEYNGKFMINQMVLRGGSCATSMNHIRTSYRNFFPPHLRWQYTGVRLAK